VGALLGLVTRVEKGGALLAGHRRPFRRRAGTS
jgi:hypothetical protein